MHLGRVLYAGAKCLTHDCRIRFFCAAEAEPFELFENIVTVEQSKALASRAASKEKLDALVVDDNLGFTKDRTVSRLFEMQSIECVPSSNQNVMHREACRRQAKCCRVRIGPDTLLFCSVHRCTSYASLRHDY